MRITRINSVTGKEEFWNKPPGLPGIWMTPGFCDRCKEYKDCLGLLGLSDAEWEDVQSFIHKTNNSTSIFDLEKVQQLKKCGV